jgi:hypothetical protein
LNYDISKHFQIGPQVYSSILKGGKWRKGVAKTTCLIFYQSLRNQLLDDHDST